MLASPVQETLYFAGEATVTDAQTGAVFGAFESGLRAAGEVLAALPRSTGTSLAGQVKQRSTSKERKIIMPGKSQLKGATAKEKRQYEHIKESAQKSGRYGKRAKEVAARTVMKHHASNGRSKGH